MPKKNKRPTRESLEVRSEDAETGGQKGVKPSRLDLLPPSVLDEISRVYSMGAEKYSDTNYLKGYDWRKSLGAMLRHINLWNGGESYDEESGLHHLAHAAWHCNTLMMFEWNELGTDDRLEVRLAEGTLHDGEEE